MQTFTSVYIPYLTIHPCKYLSLHLSIHTFFPFIYPCKHSTFHFSKHLFIIQSCKHPSLINSFILLFIHSFSHLCKWLLNYFPSFLLVSLSLALCNERDVRNWLEFLPWKIHSLWLNYVFRKSNSSFPSSLRISGGDRGFERDTYRHWGDSCVGLLCIWNTSARDLVVQR